MASIVDNPTDIANWRRRLFNLTDPEITLTDADWDSIWPYIDNFWVERNACRGKETQQFNCRIWRNDSSKKAGEGKRNRTRRNVEPCGMKMFVKKKEGGVVISRFPGRTKETLQHNHDLEYLDKIKTPSAIMKIAADQVAQGKTPSEAVTELKGQTIVKALEEAGGLVINSNRVRNAYKSRKHSIPSSLPQRTYQHNHQNVPLQSPSGAKSTMTVACQCGNISFETPTARPLDLYHCHCLECRKQSASAFGTSAIFSAKGIFPLSLELLEKLSCYTRPGKNGSMDCYFCTQCGVRIMHRGRSPDGIEGPNVSIKGGCIEDLDWNGGKHIYTRSAVVPIPLEAEQYRESPEPEPEPSPASRPPIPVKEHLILPDFPEHPFP